ncbi:hypothetical protein MPSEU_001004700 [Mayamaea pseudoterrestris]|nr:hypothetical protein MPSEU_001004700 [Mayamaea pseudoterrestris]
MIFAEMLKTDDYYGLYVENIHLRMHGGGRVQPSRQSHYNVWYETVSMRTYAMNRSPFIVDSGTSSTLFNKNLEFPFSDAWKALTGKHYSPHREYVYDRDELDDYLPTLLFQLSPSRRNENDLSAPWIVNTLDRYNRGSILVAMPPSHYMRYIEENNVWISRIFFTSDSKQTLGSNFMQGKNILFDIENERMGFAESSCSNDQVASNTSKKKRRRETDFRDAIDEKILDLEASCSRLCRSSIAVLGIAILIAGLTCAVNWKLGAQQQHADPSWSASDESKPFVSSYGPNGLRYT